MKNLRIALFLLAVPIAYTAAFAQASSTPPERPSPRVTQAHCQYTPSDPACQHLRQPNPSSGQCRQAARCPSPCCDYPPTRPPFVYDSNYSTHAGTGALIGFGIGAAAGAARDGDSGTRFVSAMLVGGFGALIGAAIGHGIPARPWRHHRPAWDDPNENAANPRPNSQGATGSGRQTVSAD